MRVNLAYRYLSSQSIVNFTATAAQKCRVLAFESNVGVVIRYHPSRLFCGGSLGAVACHPNIFLKPP